MRQKCEKCGKLETGPTIDYIMIILLLFISALIGYFSINHIGPKYFGWPLVPYWDVFCFLFLLRATVGCVCTSLRS